MPKKDIVYDNQWWFWAKSGTHTCCDCGLVHDVVMQVTKKKLIKTKWARNKNKTRYSRKKAIGRTQI